MAYSDRPREEPRMGEGRLVHVNRVPSPHVDSFSVRWRGKEKAKWEDVRLISFLMLLLLLRDRAPFCGRLLENPS
jgi:hypothetical protein